MFCCEIAIIINTKPFTFDNVTHREQTCLKMTTNLYLMTIKKSHNDLLIHSFIFSSAIGLSINYYWPISSLDHWYSLIKNQTAKVIY